jgi:NAD(P)-dependent dehydrogenase (short-subunit alcohol dehydrogenase family)
MARNGRVAVVTGASSGIGLETAKALAARGLHVIALGRDPERSAAAEREIRNVAAGKVDFLRADLSRLADVRRIAGEIAALTDRIDLLVNNAGGMADRVAATSEGLEQCFAANHLGPFLLTDLLLPLLRHAARGAEPGGVRVLVTASAAGEMIDGLDWDDLQSFQADAGATYCRGKLANLLFTRGLAARTAADGIVVHAMHPGVVASNFIHHADAATQAYIRTFEAQTPEQGADTLVWLATADEPGRTSGGYFHERAPRPFHPQAEDVASVDRLWRESERLVATA